MTEWVNNNGKRALLIGVGGIGSNVYLTELQQYGYDVTTVDNTNPADHTSIDTVQGVFDVAVICVPNFLHTYFADECASFCKVIFIEKPGLPSADQWNALCDKHPHTKFIMCKNNMYRDTYGFLDNVSQIDDITSIKINWLNKNRVPNPGYWSTNRKQSWGGVALDLFPHLYCQMIRHFGKIPQFTRVNHLMMQKSLLVPLIFGLFIKKTPQWAPWMTVMLGLSVSWFMRDVLTPQVFASWIGIEAFTVREARDMSLILTLAGHVFITGGFFCLTGLFYKEEKDSFVAEREYFFADLETPVIADNDQDQYDLQQRNKLGMMVMIMGSGMLLMSLIPNPFWGRMIFLTCALVIFGIGFLLKRSIRIEAVSA